MEMLGAASHPSAAGQAQPDGVFTIGGRPALAAEYMKDSVPSLRQWVDA